MGKGEYYQARLTPNNTNTPVGLGVTAATPAGAAISGLVLVPPNSAAPSYDFDGNLTADGLWNCVWDAENRLVEMTSSTSLAKAAQE